MKIDEALEWIRQQLKQHHQSDSPSLDAQIILEKITGLHRPVLLSHPERDLSAAEAASVRELTGRLLTGEPLPYVLGEWPFFGHSFRVTPDVLIPRPETELLVEAAVDWLKEHPEVRTGADIGTGSGCIALSILAAFPERKLDFAGVDRSFPALRIAAENAARFGLSGRIRWVHGDLSMPLRAPLRLICANLPYIPSQRCLELDVSKTEPQIALDGGTDGFDLYRALFVDLQQKMAPDGLILCEIEYSQKKVALETAKTFFPKAGVIVREDLSGLPRILSIRFPEEA